MVRIGCKWAVVSSIRYAVTIIIIIALIASSIIGAAIIIGLITFVLSYLGVYIGKRFGHLFESKIEALGGVILIAIGIKILIEHLYF